MKNSFVWNKNFETGIFDVDKEHQHLVDLINDFGYLLSKNQIKPNDFETLFWELADYSQYHFSNEEKRMNDIGVDKRHIEKHIKCHQAFLGEVTYLYKNVSFDDINAAKQLLRFLTHWLVYHILGADQNMGRQIVAIQSGSTPIQAWESEERQEDRAVQPLLAALNCLFQKVAESRKELSRLSFSLDEQVEERTRNLADANLYLEKLASTDAMTSLSNRRYGLQQLSLLWDESAKAETPIVCIMADTDYFKEINDNYGHEAGDLVLCQVATTLQDAIRSDDILCRLGGDEFLIICPNTDQKGGLYVAEILRKKISELQILVGDGSWKGSISLGVAARTPEQKNYEELLRLADKAVYRAKKDGRNCVRS